MLQGKPTAQNYQIWSDINWRRISNEGHRLSASFNYNTPQSSSESSKLVEGKRVLFSTRRLQHTYFVVLSNHTKTFITTPH